MRSVLKCLDNAIRQLDLFPTSTFLRYKGDNDYKTATGGIVSIIVIMTFVVLFASMAVRTVRREIINTSQSNQADPDPS